MPRHPPHAIWTPQQTLSLLRIHSEEHSKWVERGRPWGGYVFKNVASRLNAMRDLFPEPRTEMQCRMKLYSLKRARETSARRASERQRMMEANGGLHTEEHYRYRSNSDPNTCKRSLEGSDNQDSGYGDTSQQSMHYPHSYGAEHPETMYKRPRHDEYWMDPRPRRMSFSSNRDQSQVSPLPTPTAPTHQLNSHLYSHDSHVSHSYPNEPPMTSGPVPHQPMEPSTTMSMPPPPPLPLSSNAGSYAAPLCTSAVPPPPPAVFHDNGDMIPPRSAEHTRLPSLTTMSSEAPPLPRPPLEPNTYGTTSPYSDHDRPRRLSHAISLEEHIYELYRIQQKNMESQYMLQEKHRAEILEYMQQQFASEQAREEQRWQRFMEFDASREQRLLELDAKREERAAEREQRLFDAIERIEARRAEQAAQQERRWQEELKACEARWENLLINTLRHYNLHPISPSLPSPLPKTLSGSLKESNYTLSNSVSVESSDAERRTGNETASTITASRADYAVHMLDDSSSKHDGNSVEEDNEEHAVTSAAKVICNLADRSAEAIDSPTHHPTSISTIMNDQSQ